MSAAVYGGSAAVEAVREFLEDGTHGGASSPAQTLNGFLADCRENVWGITESVLPDVAVYETVWPSGAQANAFPYMAIVWDGCEGQDGGPGSNSRMFDHRIELLLVVPQSVIDGDQQAVALAALRYQDAIRTFFLRRLPMGEQGWTANNGGTGLARGRVVRCEITSQAQDSEGLTSPNFYVQIRLLVRMQEAY
jgi:hypothetical protein